jgi:hypothetical protein
LQNFGYAVIRCRSARSCDDDDDGFVVAFESSSYDAAEAVVRAVDRSMGDPRPSRPRLERDDDDDDGRRRRGRGWQSRGGDQMRRRGGCGERKAGNDDDDDDDAPPRGAPYVCELDGRCRPIIMVAVIADDDIIIIVVCRGIVRGR